ncbi:hypothetical protein LCGC14_2980480, partial [marine sediment metagenome]
MLEQFVEAYNKLVAEYGHQLQAVAQPEQMGVIVQVRPQLIVVPVEGWEANVDQRNTPGHDEGDTLHT